MLLELKKINKSYKYGKEKQSILHLLDLSFKSGEFVSILGESGCGKSTLLNIIGGMDSDYDGEVIVNGKNLREINRDNYRKLEIGFIFQNFNLIPHLTVLDNVVLALEMSSSPMKKEKARELLTKLGLKDHIHKKPNQLSGGQKQRVAIARALANDPKIILADEPTGSLDQNTSRQIIDILKDIVGDGKLVIVVTHSQNVAINGTRIVRMGDGKIYDDEIINDNIINDKADIVLKPKNLPFLKAIKLAFHNIKINIKRNVLVAIGGSIGILSVVLMFAIGSGIEKYINEQIEASMDPNLIQITKNNSEIEKIRFTESDIDIIKSINNVDYIEKNMLYDVGTNIVLKDKNVAPTTFTTSLDGIIVLSSDEKSKLPKDNEILISDSIAINLMGETNYKDIVGQKVSVYITDVGDDNRPVLIEAQLTVSNILENVSSYDIAYVTYNTLDTIYTSNGIVLHPSGINLYANEIDDIEDIKANLKTAGFADSGIAEMLEQVTAYLNIATFILAGIAAISLIVSGIMILVVLYISVVERTKEIGILKAIGARKKDIRRIFFTESALLGFFSGTLGVVGASLIGYVGNNYLRVTFDAEFIDVNLEFILLGIIVSMIVSIAAGLIPSSKASKLDPMESLRYE